VVALIIAFCVWIVVLEKLEYYELLANSIIARDTLKHKGKMQFPRWWRVSNQVEVRLGPANLAGRTHVQGT
jgi:hypothetical protein